MSDKKDKVVVPEVATDASALTGQLPTDEAPREETPAVTSAASPAPAPAELAGASDEDDLEDDDLEDEEVEEDEDDLDDDDLEEDDFEDQEEDDEDEGSAKAASTAAVAAPAQVIATLASAGDDDDGLGDDDDATAPASGSPAPSGSAVPTPPAPTSVAPVPATIGGRPGPSPAPAGSATGSPPAATTAASTTPATGPSRQRNKARHPALKKKTVKLFVRAAAWNGAKVDDQDRVVKNYPTARIAALLGLSEHDVDFLLDDVWKSKQPEGRANWRSNEEQLSAVQHDISLGQGDRTLDLLYVAACRDMSIQPRAVLTARPAPAPISPQDHFWKRVALTLAGIIIFALGVGADRLVLYLFSK